MAHKQLNPDPLILGLLADGPRHGYDLLSEFTDPARLGRIWNMSASQVYAVLKRLDKQGLIRGERRFPQDAPPRTAYQTTIAGQQVLHNWLDATPSANVRSVRVEFLSRLYVAHRLNLPTLPIVERQRDACQARLERIRAERETAPLGVPHLSADLIASLLEAALAWLDRCYTDEKENLS